MFLYRAATVVSLQNPVLSDLMELDMKPARKTQALRFVASDGT